MISKQKSRSSKTAKKQVSRVSKPLPASYAITRTNAQRPTVRSTNGSTIVSHTEYVADIVTDANDGSLFYTTQFPINPGMSTTFPWLSTIAPSFESYRFRSLMFRYEPTVPTSTQGVVSLAVDFDAADSAPTTKMDFMSNHRAVRSSAFSTAVYQTDMKDAETMTSRKFVRFASLPSNRDIKTYDLGNLFVATADFLSTFAGASAGELYVSYVVELYTPQLDTSGFARGHSLRITADAFGGVSPIGSVRSVAGGLPHVTTTDSLEFGTVGEFLVSWYLESNTIGASPVDIIVAKDVEITKLTQEVANPLTNYAGFWSVRVLKPNGIITFSFNNGATNPSASVVRISGYSYSVQ